MGQLAITIQALKEFATLVFSAFSDCYIILSMPDLDLSNGEFCKLGKMHSFVTLTYL